MTPGKQAVGPPGVTAGGSVARRDDDDWWGYDGGRRPRGPLFWGLVNLTLILGALGLLAACGIVIIFRAASYRLEHLDDTLPPARSTPGGGPSPGTRPGGD